MTRNDFPVLADAFLASDTGAVRLAKQAALVAAAVMLVTAAAHVRIPMWPVPVTMQTFAVLLVGAAYGARLAGLSMLAYLGLGAMGLAVFTGNGGAQGGLAYIAGPTGGYLVGFVAAAAMVGWLAQRGWDRTVGRMAAALLAGNAVIYLFGLSGMAWLFAAEKGMGWVMQWGMVNFLPGDLLKLALAAAIFPLTRGLLAR